MLETQYQIMHCDPHVTPAYQSITLTWFCLSVQMLLTLSIPLQEVGRSGWCLCIEIAITLLTLMQKKYSTNVLFHHTKQLSLYANFTITLAEWIPVHSQTYLCFCLCSRQFPPTPSTPPLSAAILHSGGSKKVLFLVLLFYFRSDSLWRELNLIFL